MRHMPMRPSSVSGLSPAGGLSLIACRRVVASTRPCRSFTARAHHSADPSPPVVEERSASAGNGAGRREALAAAALASVSGSLPFSYPLEALAIGPTDVFFDIVSYEEVECKEGAPKDARCIVVTANADSKSKKTAYNSEIFGRVRYKNGESAMYGDFAEATDAGKIGDVSEIVPGKSVVTFTLLLDSQSRGRELVFVSQGDMKGTLKARAYPGMRQDFRVMAPVSETIECDASYEICD